MNEEEVLTPVVESTQLGGSVGDTSIWTLLVEADPVVQGVMLLLAVSR